MKKLIRVFVFLFITVCSVKAQQLRINNNTACDIEVAVYVWDVPCSTPATTGPYIGVVIPASQFQTFLGVSSTDEYVVQMVVDAAPGGIYYPMPVIAAAGICNPDIVDSSPTTPCISNVVTAAISTGAPNYVMDVN